MLKKICTAVGSTPVAPLRLVRDLKSKLRKLKPWNLVVAVVVPVAGLLIVFNKVCMVAPVSRTEDHQCFVLLGYLLILGMLGLLCY